MRCLLPTNHRTATHHPPFAARIIGELQQQNIEIVIISGDHEKPTQKLAQELGIAYSAETLCATLAPKTLNVFGGEKILRFASPWGKGQLIADLQAAPKGHAVIKADPSVSLATALTIRLQ